MTDEQRQRLKEARERRAATLDRMAITAERSFVDFIKALVGRPTR